MEIACESRLVIPKGQHAVVELTIVIVNWNSEDYLRECIASIYANTHQTSYEIIVVDNASPAGLIDEIKKSFPGVKLVKSASNLGFSRANNLGFAHATGSHVLFLNPDTMLYGAAIDILMVQFRSLSNPGIVGARLVDPDLKVQTTTIRRFPTILNEVLDIEWLRLRWPNCRLWDFAQLFAVQNSPVPVEVLSGACMLLRKETFAAVGMFCEDFFMYAEDIDLSRKTVMLGLTNYYVSDAIIIHYGGTSSSKHTVSQWSTVMKCQAKKQYFIRYRGHLYALTYQIAMVIAAFARLALLCGLSKGMKTSGLVVNRQSSFAKWNATLKWALGFSSLILRRR
jgi:GT2 family glycosyltransferase